MKFDRLLWGVMILAAGIILLGVNLGWWDSGIWSRVADLWPLLIILFGIGIIFGNSNAVAITLLLIALVLSVLYISNYRNIQEKITKNDFSVLESRDFSGGLSGISSAKISIKLGAANIKIGSLSNGDKLFEGSYTSNTDINIKNTITDSRADITLSENVKNFDFFRDNKREFNLRLAKSIPLEMRIDCGASKYDLDLSSLKITEIDINAGASDGQVKIGAELNKVSVNIDAGASRTTILVPKDSALSVKSDSALTDDNFSEIGLKKEGDFFRSENFADNIKQIELKISAGASRVNIERY